MHEATNPGLSPSRSIISCNLEANLKGKELQKLIKACLRGQPAAQETLYRGFYGYAMGIGLRYAQTREEAEEIVNDGFLKVFLRLETHDQLHSFKSWIRRIFINAAIDHHRKHEKHYQVKNIEFLYDQQTPSTSLEQLSEQELIRLIQLLPPAYRLVFNLYAIEGFKHREIAEKLEITIGTSKSNLAKARKHLQRMVRVAAYESSSRYG